MQRQRQQHDNANTQGRYWCFTLNNYTEEDEERLRALPDSHPRVSFIQWGRETGESGTPHLQGYLELDRRLRLRQLRVGELLGPRVHCERRRGTAQEAKTYTEKDGDFEAHGSASVDQSGKRNDLGKIQEQIEAGSSELEIAQEYFSQWCYHRKSFAKYAQLIQTNGLRTDLKIYVLWGESGVGKTRYVFGKYPDVFSVPDPDLRWFDGYTGQETVLIDEYRGTADDSFLLKLFDIYPLQVAVKGSFVNWRPKRIFVTSNMQPPFGHDAIERPLKRRVHHIVKITMTTTIEQIDGAFAEQDAIE